jgi:TolA-binding protein
MSNEVPRASLFESHRTTRTIARVLLFIGGLAATAVGCAWMGTSHSVRFNGYQTEREMGRLPPLPTLANGMNELRAYWGMEDVGQSPDDDYTVGEKRSKEVDALWDRAEAAERDGNLRLDRELLRQYLQRTGIARDVWFNPSSRQQRRNSAIDRLEALSALDRGSSASSVQAYLNARCGHDGDKPVAEEIQLALDLAESDINLRDNVAYLRAAELYRQKDFEKAAHAFSALAHEYPHSEKREASLFMAAVAVMKTSQTYTPTGGDEAHLHEGERKSVDTPSVAPVDPAWHNSFAAFKRLMTEYPHGQYLSDARGWLAYLMLRHNDRAGALVEYYRLLADKHDENARIEAAFSLTLVRHHASDEEMSRVEKQLEKEPDAALAYAYHNIYNYAIDAGDSFPPYDHEEIKDYKGNVEYEAQRRRDEEREKDWKRNRAWTGRKELSRVLNFSRRLIASHPNLAVGGGFALRAAQASVELGDNETAAQFAHRAVQSRISSDERAQALWTYGEAEHRLHHFESARKSFQTLLRDYPKSRLIEGARRTLAMIAEDAGDIDGALEQYIALDYSIDVAYFVDVLMTTEQLAGFIQRHADSPKTNELTYALGLRYLRANRWDVARKTLARVRTAGVPDYSIYSSGSNCLKAGAVPTNCVDPKQTNFDAQDKPMINPSLVMRDVQTANDLEALERTVNQAEGDEAKAEAFYQLASYQYEASSLLFYNPIAWSGGRYWNLSQIAGTGRYRVANESQILWNHMQEHERLARSLRIYLEVVRRFPRTRAARDSLYTAAVCHERLSNYNPYWRDIYEAGLHAGSRMVTYSDVKAAYPGYQLPRGTYGWQPSTRTVNGGSGWVPPPERIQHPTRTARLKLLALSLADHLESFWNEKGRRWLTAMTILVAVWFTGRVATQNRKRLRARIARLRIQHAKQVVSYPWSAMFWIDPMEAGHREKVKQFLKDSRTEFWELARDGKSRPILLRNILSHSLLIGLLLSLSWTLHFG